MLPPSSGRCYIFTKMSKIFILSRSGNSVIIRINSYELLFAFCLVKSDTYFCVLYNIALTMRALYE